MTRVDHILVSVDDLAAARERWSRSGLAATIGGRHPGGTSNALIRGPRPAYLELITATGDATSPAGRRVLSTQGPISWALGVTDIARVRAAAQAAGAEPGPVTDGSREKPNGEVLRWRICDLMPTALHPFVPFLIEWEADMPPGRTDGPVLRSMAVDCPDPRWLSDVLSACGLAIDQTGQGSGDGVVHSDGEVAVVLKVGEGGVHGIELEAPDAAFVETELDGLHLRAKRR